MAIDVDDASLPASSRRVIVNTKEDVTEFFEHLSQEPVDFKVKTVHGDLLFDAEVQSDGITIYGTSYDRAIVEHYCQLALMQGTLIIEENLPVKKTELIHVIVFRGIPILAYTSEGEQIELSSGMSENVSVNNWNEVLSVASFSQFSSGLKYVLVSIVCGDDGVEVYNIRTDPGLNLSIKLKRLLLSRVFVLKELKIKCLGPLHGAYLASYFDKYNWDPDLITCCM